MNLSHLRRGARRFLAGGLALGALGLAACDDSTGAEVYRFTTTLDANGSAVHLLPREVGSPQDLPVLACYTSGDGFDWFVVASVEGVSNCLLVESRSQPGRLEAVLEGETPGWLAQFVVVYED